MTYQEYYLQTASRGGFIQPADFSQALKLSEIYGTEALLQATHLANILNTKIVVIGGNLAIDTSREIDAVGFLNQYGLAQLLKSTKDGFNERETENKRDLAITINSDNSTVNTFKSFPQVVGDELTANNKVAESETVNSGEAETTNEAERDLTRQHNSVEATEYLAHKLADMLTVIARDYVQLTALDGIYSQPEDLDD